jgi:SNF2 family DNA or RNA helicase
MPALRSTLMPYQVEAVEWCLEKEATGCILAYDMGLGKTVIACGLMVKNPMKTLVMAPLGLLEQWSNEIKKHTSGLRVMVYHGGKRFTKAAQKEMDAADIILSTPAIVGRDLHDARDIPAARWIIDEAHRLKNSKGKTYQRLYEEADTIPNKLFLTGTPICNRCDDLVSLVCLTNFAPYNSLQFWKDKRMETKTEELKELLPNIFQRRTKASTIPGVLPKITYKSIPVSLPKKSKQWDTYESFMEDKEILRRILRMRQSANNHSQLLEVRDETAAVKIEKLTKLLGTIPKTDKVLVFSQFTSFLAYLNELFPDNSFYHGGLSADEKEETLMEFKSLPEKQILFINLRAGGCGLNLVEANHVILLEPYWNESEQKQAIDRVYRIGQQKPVKVYRFYLRNSVESWIHSLQRTKQTLANYLVDSQDYPDMSLKDLQGHYQTTGDLLHYMVMNPKPYRKNDVKIAHTDGSTRTLTELLEAQGLY